MDINFSFNPFDRNGYLGRLRYFLYTAVCYLFVSAIVFVLSTLVITDIINSCNSALRCESDVEAAYNFFLYFGLALTYLLILGFTTRRCHDLGLASGWALLLPVFFLLSSLPGIGLIFSVIYWAFVLILYFVPATIEPTDAQTPKAKLA